MRNDTSRARPSVTASNSSQKGEPILLAERPDKPFSSQFHFTERQKSFGGLQDEIRYWIFLPSISVFWNNVRRTFR